MDSHFTHPSEYYKRDLNVVKHYLNDAAFFLHKRTAKPLDQCLAFVKEQAKEHMVDPETEVLERQDNGDRKVVETTFSQYLNAIEAQHYILAPTLTLYTPASEKQADLSLFIEENIARRKRSKKEMFEANDEATKTFKNNEQASFKIFNNSLSGAQKSTSTILYNKTAHPSLTSLCRTATSYGNANNERFLQGNRHYWSPEIAQANIISIVRHTDYSLLEKAIKHHGLVCPSVEQTQAVVERSASLYWKNPEKLSRIAQLIQSLTPIERAAFVYTGDLYHLAQYNDAVVRTFIDRLSMKASTESTHPDKTIERVDSDLLMFVSLLCAEELNGEPLSVVKTTRFSDYAKIAATIEHIRETLDAYQWLIKALWRTESVPNSMAHIRSSLRRCVVTSDTDSTIFTKQYWVQWFCGSVCFDQKANAVSYAITYLITQTIIHLLATISAGIGVEEKHLHTLSMKNEFSYPVFSLTSMAKHYFAYILAQEGHVFSQYETEIKGVYLKDSNAPRETMDRFHQTLRSVMDTVIAQQKIDLQQILEMVASIENDVKESIASRNTLYLPKAKVDGVKAYKKAAVSPYVNYLLWQEVFAQDYGSVAEPPYEAIKLSLNLDRPSKVKGWIDSIENRPLADRIARWLHRNKKTTLTMFLVPRSIVTANGFPKEFISVLDTRKIIYQTTKPFYTLLESLGVYYINDDHTRLVSDYITPSK